jgi:hypothetical protein
LKTKKVRVFDIESLAVYELEVDAEGIVKKMKKVEA